MLCLDLGWGQGEQQPCQLDAQMCTIMEKNSQILPSRTSRELTDNYLPVLGSVLALLRKLVPSFNCLLGGSLLVARRIAGDTVYS